MTKKTFAPFELKMTEQQAFDGLKSTYGNELTAADVRAFAAMNNIGYGTVTKKIKKYRVSPGKWNLTVTKKSVENIEKSFKSPSAMPAAEKNLVPQKDDTFVRFGSFQDVKKIIASKLFYPTFVTGLSGNGKTFGIEQACAQLGREIIRVNITIETDEDDLIGGFRLVNGETVWHNGPVIEALERGAILLLDEIDLASNKILCLQSVLEGNGIFLKKIGRFVRPARGFNVLATANTKGKGSDDGRFIGTNVLNEAFLERFPVTFEQAYPSVNNEIKLLGLHANTIGINDTEFVKKLVDWADIIRKTFYDGGIEDLISTRRLVHIVRAFSIFKNKAKAIQVCINRFDDETKQSFMELYDKVDADFEMPETNESVEKL